jgi:CubicO group peptidase (beta-lactamase class C family)
MEVSFLALLLVALCGGGITIVILLLWKLFAKKASTAAAGNHHQQQHPLSEEITPLRLSEDDLSDTVLQEAINRVAIELNLVGMAAKVVVDGHCVAKAVTGLRRMAQTQDQEEQLLELGDLFHVGSIGKSMSATAIARLVEAEVMTWDDTLGDRLLHLIPNMHSAWYHVKLSQLLTHTACMGRASVKDMFQKTSDSRRIATIRRDVASRILSKPPNGTPGTAHSYSNEGYVIASIMAEEATGQSWERIIQQQLVEPLSLNTLGFGAPMGTNVPWGHRKTLSSLLLPSVNMKRAHNPQDSSSDNPPWMAAAGTVHMSIDDLITFGRAHLENSVGGMGTNFLSAATLQRLHEPVLNDYAYGWVVQQRTLAGNQPETVLWHNGSNTMWYALLVVLPKHNTVMALVTNDGSRMQQTQRRFDALAMEIGVAIARKTSFAVAEEDVA